MQSLYKTIITPLGSRYENHKYIDGQRLTMNATIDDKDFKYTNRIAKVLKTPLLKTPYQEGDEIIVHHNVFRQYWGFTTHLRTSSSDLNDGTFGVYIDQVFAYRKPDSEWTMLNDWIFVKPIEALRGGLILSMDHNVTLEGKLVYGAVKGLKTGARVGFTPNSEYIFDIEGERYYKMRERDITCNIY